jgi:NAD(P)-dependent dehydrogenase (short-subunit alcohol dehydrogenase family)
MFRRSFLLLSVVTLLQGALGVWPFSCRANATVYEVATFLSLPDHVVVVTGADGRSGLQISLAAALANATVVLQGRNATHLATAASSIRDVVPTARLDTAVFDLSDLNATARGAAALVKKYPKVDVLVNNAGGIDSGLTGDGYVGTWQVNAIAPALITAILTPALERAPSPRVVYVASASNFDGATPGAWPAAARRTAADMVKYAQGSPAVGMDADYGMSKLVLVYYVQELSKRAHKAKQVARASTAPTPSIAHISVNPGFFRAPPFTPEQKAQCAQALRFSPCPQTPAQGGTSTAFAALTPGAEAAAGQMIDFTTDSGAGGWVQSGDTCIPRSLPTWVEAESEKWYDAVQEIVGRFV